MYIIQPGTYSFIFEGINKDTEAATLSFETDKSSNALSIDPAKHSNSGTEIVATLYFALPCEEG
jgi:hypothetical protein